MPLIPIQKVNTVQNNKVPAKINDREVTQLVSGIVSQVIKIGDQALVEYTKEFDQVHLETIQVPKNTIQTAEKKLDSKTRKIVEQAIQKNRHFHEFQQQKSWSKVYDDGTILGEKVTPLERVGIYVPGGKAFYPSNQTIDSIFAS